MTYFFTVDLAERSCRLLSGLVDYLREVVRDVNKTRSYEIIASVVLLYDLHAVWHLPEGDSDYLMRWGLIKSNFSRTISRTLRIGIYAACSKGI